MMKSSKEQLCQRKKIDNKECIGNGKINKITAYFNGKAVCQKCWSNLKFIENHPNRFIGSIYLDNYINGKHQIKDAEN